MGIFFVVKSTQMMRVFHKYLKNLWQNAEPGASFVFIIGCAVAKDSRHNAFTRAKSAFAVKLVGKQEVVISLYKSEKFSHFIVTLAQGVAVLQMFALGLFFSLQISVKHENSDD